MANCQVNEAAESNSAMIDTAVCMARDRSRRPSSELAGLLQPDGSVIVPPAIAREVLRTLVFAITERVRSTGGQPSAATRRLLAALDVAAERHKQQPEAAEHQEQHSPASEVCTVREAADRMGCSPQWIRHLLTQGRLSGRRAPGGWIVYLDRPLADPQGPQRSA